MHKSAYILIFCMKYISYSSHLWYKCDINVLQVPTVTMMSHCMYITIWNIHIFVVSQDPHLRYVSSHRHLFTCWFNYDTFMERQININWNIYTYLQIFGPSYKSFIPIFKSFVPSFKSFIPRYTWFEDRYKWFLPRFK